MGVPVRRAIPEQRTRGQRRSCDPAPDDPDRRPLLPYADPQPRPLRRTYPRGWVPGSEERAKAQTAKALLILATLDADRPTREQHLARIAELEDECGRLRLRADLGSALAGHVEEIGRIRALLLADDEHAAAATGEIAVVREARAS